MARQKKSKQSFEEDLAELEALVDSMEQGELSLEESLHSFERGVQLTRSCQQALQAVEQKIEILLAKSGKAGLEPFDDEG